MTGGCFNFKMKRYGFKIAFFDTKPYDRASFDEVNEKYGFEILYHKGAVEPE